MQLKTKNGARCGASYGARCSPSCSARCGASYVTELLDAICLITFKSVGTFLATQ